MSLIQTAALAGMCFGAGLVALAWQLIPSNPELGSVFERLSPERNLIRIGPARNSSDTISGSGRVGLWVMRSAPWLMLGKTPAVDLELLQIPLHRFYAQKVEAAALGFFAPVFMNLLLWLTGSGTSITLSVIGCFGLAILFSIQPNAEVAARAKDARRTFAWALIAYIELVAVERHAGSDPRQALERAADMSDSWVFQRIREELARSRWAGESPWEGLTRMGNQLQLDALVDFSEVMRLSGEDGAEIYQILRSRAASLRSEIVNTNLGDATAQATKMAIPTAFLFLCFAVLLMTPVALKMMVG